MRTNGFVIYRGPSMIDGSDIVAVATGIATPSQNAKTGPMVQTFIMPASVAPKDAVKTGADAGVCGDCKFRPVHSDACYVVVGQSVQSVWQAWQRGSYVDVTPQAFLASELTRDPKHAERMSYCALSVDVGDRRAIRLGAWGDPAAVPVKVWVALTLGASTHTGYTHQWREINKRPLGQARAMRELCMASVDTLEELQEAQATGWRTYRVASSAAPATRTEIPCPYGRATKSDGSPLQCIDCSLCKGTATAAKSITITVHGTSARKALRVID